MTTTSRTIKRETFSSVRIRRSSRPIVIELNTTYLRVKPKGTRTWFTATYDQVYTVGAMNAAAELRRLRDEARKARRRR